MYIIKSLIFVIEDNPDVLFNIQITLEANNYIVVTAENGKVAASTLLTGKISPDVIISDIMMPEMDGYEFYQFLATNDEFRKIPIFFLSALATPDDIRFARLLGVHSYITKPFEEEELLAMIEKKLEESETNNVPL